MTPKEKALYLVNKFYPRTTSYASDRKNQNENSKLLALILIDEVLLFSEKLGIILYQEVGTDSYYSRCKNADLASYYKEVKQELEKL